MLTNDHNKICKLYNTSLWKHKGAIFHSFTHLLNTKYELDKHHVVRKTEIKNKFKKSNIRKAFILAFFFLIKHLLFLGEEIEKEIFLSLCYISIV